MNLDDGRYALIEYKLGSRDIEDGAKHLLEIKRLIAEKNKTEKQIRVQEPDLLIVLTGGEMTYTREDGVKVIPIGCLRDLIEQILNHYIKEILKDLSETVPTLAVKVPTKLTHTARRSGITNMYLSHKYTILQMMHVSGHKTQKTSWITSNYPPKR